MKLAPNVKLLPKDKGEDAVIFAGMTHTATQSITCRAEKPESAATKYHLFISDGVTG